MLAAEKYHLTGIKKILELNCKNIVNQMQVKDFFSLLALKIPSSSDWTKFDNVWPKSDENGPLSPN